MGSLSEVLSPPQLPPSWSRPNKGLSPPTGHSPSSLPCSPGSSGSASGFLQSGPAVS